MRTLLIVLASSAIVACGNGDSNDRPASGPTGTVGGRGFNTTEARAVVASSSTPCTVPLLGQVGIAGMKLDFASYANVCGDYSTAQCKAHANAQSVSVILAKLNAVPPAAAPALGPGTYTIHANQTTAIPDQSHPGQLDAGFALSLATNATCAGAPSPAVEGGTLRIDQVTSTEITGSVNVTFADGSALQGPFTAPLCGGASFDLCQIASSGSFCENPAAPTCL